MLLPDGSVSSAAAAPKVLLPSLDDVMRIACVFEGPERFFTRVPALSPTKPLPKAQAGKGDILIPRTRELVSLDFSKFATALTDVVSPPFTYCRALMHPGKEKGCQVLRFTFKPIVGSRDNEQANLEEANYTSFDIAKLMEGKLYLQGHLTVFLNPDPFPQKVVDEEMERNQMLLLRFEVAKLSMDPADHEIRISDKGELLYV